MTCDAQVDSIDIVQSLFFVIIFLLRRVFHGGTIYARGNSLKEPASKAYEQVFASHHMIQKVVGASMFLLFSNSQFPQKLHEEGEFRSMVLISA